MLVPVGNKVGLTCVSLGVIRAIEQKGTAVTFFKPIDKFTGGHPKGSTNNILKTQKNIKQKCFQNNRLNKVFSPVANNYKNTLFLFFSY